MFHVDEFDAQRIIKIIDSIDDTLQYSSIDLFKRAMTSVGFVVRKLKTYPKFSSYSGQGKIGDHYVYLDIYQKNNSNLFYLYRKSYYIEKLIGTSVKKLSHRDNDLPTLIYYDEHHGKVSELRYFTNNIQCREFGKPLNITYEYDQLQNISSTECRFINSHEDINFSVYSVTYVDNLIVDGAVCYNNELLSIKKLDMILPDIKMVDLNDLFNLKNIITKAHLKLIEMFTI